jgi:hypothetical protein
MFKKGLAAFANQQNLFFITDLSLPEKNGLD